MIKSFWRLQQNINQEVSVLRVDWEFCSKELIAAVSICLEFLRHLEQPRIDYLNARLPFQAVLGDIERYHWNRFQYFFRIGTDIEIKGVQLGLIYIEQYFFIPIEIN